MERLDQRSKKERKKEKGIVQFRKTLRQIGQRQFRCTRFKREFPLFIPAVDRVML